MLQGCICGKENIYGVARTHVRGVPEEIIQQEVKSKKNRTKWEDN